MNHIELGRYGEDLATNYLKSQGYDVLERNIRYRFGEVDIIAKKENMLIVVEVKNKTDPNLWNALRGGALEKETTHTSCHDLCFWQPVI